MNFLPNRILLSQVHARARKHTDTHKLACKSSLVKIRCPLSWENIWPHILFFKIRASRSPAADHVCVCIYTMQYTNEYTYVPTYVLHSKHFKPLGALAICLHYFKKNSMDIGWKMLTLKKDWATANMVCLVSKAQKHFFLKLHCPQKWMKYLTKFCPS